MARWTMAALRFYIADSAPELQPDHTTASGGLPEYGAEGLESLRAAVTEIIEGAAASAEESVTEFSEEEDQEQPPTILMC